MTAVVSGPSLTEGQANTLLRAFVQTVIPGLEVTIGQENRVSEPAADDYVVFWSVLRRRLGTTVTTWDQSVGGNPSAQDNTESLRMDVQLDFHGANSTDFAQVFATLFRSGYACDYFANSGMTPNYCSDGQQAPFITGEKQYSDRWMVSATFDANITVSTPQQFAASVELGLIEVDATYPPS